MARLELPQVKKRLRTADGADSAEARERMLGRLELLYGRESAGGVLEEIVQLVAKLRQSAGAKRGAPTEAPWSERDALLITYGDSVLDPPKAPLAALERFLREEVGDSLPFVHLLPFYPYSSDDGFAVMDFRKVNPELGSWNDVERLSRDYRLVFDGVINHVSASSVYMKGYAGADAKYDDFFIEPPADADTSTVLRTRNLPLFHEYETARGRKRLWTTFGPDMVDLNYANPRVLLEILDVLLSYAERGAAVIRLDAIPYLWKRLGTSCAHLPQTHEIIKLIRDAFDLAFPEVLLLTETNAPHHENLSYFGDRGDEAQMIYNFTLAPLVLFALTTGDGTKLTQWARTIEKVSDHATYLNVTATHDGIGMRPTEGILSEAERAFLCDLAYAHAGTVSGKRNPDGTLSPYELNLNYFDAVNNPNRPEPAEVEVARFMVSQAIALAFLGIPGVYIHSLVGSRNDTEAVRASGIARRINRAKMNLGELRSEIADAATIRARVFREYKRLLDLRCREKAFHPNARQEVLDLGSSVFAIRRRSDSGETVAALNNLTSATVSIGMESLTAGAAWRDILSEDKSEREGHGFFRLRPYQVAWLRHGR